MKNYELISKLMELPAGLDVKFITTVTEDDVNFETSDMCSFEKDIDDLDVSCGVVNLM
jgi:hypothetical protein